MHSPMQRDRPRAWDLTSKKKNIYQGFRGFPTMKGEATRSEQDYKKRKRGGGREKKSKLWSPIFVARAPLEGMISLGLGGRPTLLPSPSIVRQSSRSPNHPRSSLG